jgi:tetratricopeptide (TPR) repeat protein
MRLLRSRKNRSQLERERRRVAHSPGAAPLALIIAAVVTLFGGSKTLTICRAQELKTDLRGGGDNASDPLRGVETDINRNHFDAVEPRLNDYVKAHPDSSRAYYDLGYVHFRTHKIGLSIKELSRSLELNPNNAEAHKVLGLSCSIIGRYDLTEVELLQAAHIKPDSAEIHYFLGRTYYTRGVYPLAKSEFETAIQLDSSYMKAYSNLGITLEALGKTEAALQNYTTAVQLEDRKERRSEWPYIYLCAFYNRQKNPKEALNYAQQALKINSSSDTVYFEMAKAYRTLGQLEKAADAARNAVMINPRVPDYYYVLGLALRELGRPQDSQAALEKYARLQQDSTDASSKPETQEPLDVPDPQ